MAQPMSPELARAVARYGNFRDRLAQLETERITTLRQYNELQDAQEGLDEARRILVQAGRLDLIGEAS